MTAEFVLSELQSVGSPEKAAHLSRFFKTGLGQYGEGDRFLGVVVPQTRSIAKANKAMPLDELQRLLDSPWHEARLCALLVLVYRFQDKKTPEAEREKMYRFYLKNTRRCNNWDLVDLSCRDIVGEYLVNRDRSVLYELAASDNLWEQRISIVCTWAFIRRSDFTDTLALAERLMTHKHDLMHKAVGWMLREVGKRDRDTLTDFLECSAGFDKLIKCHDSITNTASETKNSISECSKPAEQRFDCCKYSRKGLLNDIQDRKQTLESGLQICRSSITEFQIRCEFSQIFSDIIKLLGCGRRKYLTECLIDRFDNTLNAFKSIFKCFDQFGSSAKIFPPLQHLIASICLGIDKSTDNLTESSPKLFGFLKITEQNSMFVPKEKRVSIW